MKKYKIYIHKNKVNGKIYVGQTSYKNINQRWRYGEGYKKSVKFYSAIKKYGWENFEHIILEECDTLEQANEREKFYIEKFKSNIKNYGYNLTSGGSEKRIITEETRKRMSESKKGNKNPMKNHIFSEEHKKRLSNSLKGRKKSKEWVEKIMRNNNHKTMLGKKHTLESKIKMSEKQKGNSKGSKKTFVLFLNDNHIEVFNKREEIYKKINFSYSYISRNRNKRSFPTKQGEIIIMSQEEYNIYIKKGEKNETN